MEETRFHSTPLFAGTLPQYDLFRSFPSSLILNIFCIYFPYKNYVYSFPDDDYNVHGNGENFIMSLTLILTLSEISKRCFAKVIKRVSVDALANKSRFIVGCSFISYKLGR